MKSTDAPLYRVWNPKLGAAEKPVELPGLVSLIQSSRVKADTWIFADSTNHWSKAAQFPELTIFFKPKSASSKTSQLATDSGVEPASLRRIKVFSQMADPQLAAFLGWMELLHFQRFAHVVRKGDFGDAMYFVLEGELRARTLIGQQETTLATLGPGDFFGEISLLDHGARSADVIANDESTVLKLTAAAMDKIVQENPAAASPFVLALAKSIVTRMRTLTKRYEDSIHFSRLAGSTG